MIKNLVLLLSITILAFSCKSKKVATASYQMRSKQEMDKSERILFKAFNSHGGKKYDSANYSFIFRKKKYTFHNENSNYTYTVTYERNGKENIIELKNDGLTRKVNGKEVELSKKEYDSHLGSLNSVIYFVTLPHKLYDPAVKRSYQGETTIKGKEYDVLEVTFNEEGGGPDHDDEYYYWINKETNRVDYLAYNYQVNNGGVRFRTAYNPRMVNGILFQDYVNYKADVGTPLSSLPELFEKEALKKLSVIETENVMEIK